MAPPKLARARTLRETKFQQVFAPTYRPYGRSHISCNHGRCLFRLLTAYRTAREMAISKTKRILAVSSTDSDRQIIDSNRTYFAR